MFNPLKNKNAMAEEHNRGKATYIIMPGSRERMKGGRDKDVSFHVIAPMIHLFRVDLFP